jgi:hypothetical protein
MAVEIANLLVLLLTAIVPIVIGFFIIYWAVRLAIRHERNREP